MKRLSGIINRIVGIGFLATFPIGVALQDGLLTGQAAIATESLLKWLYVSLFLFVLLYGVGSLIAWVANGPKWGDVQAWFDQDEKEAVAEANGYFGSPVLWIPALIGLAGTYWLQMVWPMILGFFFPLMIGWLFGALKYFGTVRDPHD